MTQPTICVLMAAYNGADHIENQLLSISEQVDVDVRIVVSLDLSTDNTAALVERFSDKHVAKTELINKGIRYGSACANFLSLIRDADITDAEYIAFSDQDDKWFPTKLITAVVRLRQGYEGYSSSVLVRPITGRSYRSGPSHKMAKYDYLFESAGQGCTYVLTRRSFLSLRQFCREEQQYVSNIAFHDWLAYIYFRTTDKKWFFDDTPCLEYVQHADNVIGARFSRKGLRSRFLLVRQGWYRSQIANALRISELISPQDYSIRKFAQIFDEPDSVRRKFMLAYLCLKHGRRRRGDRVSLAIFAVFGWI